VKEKMQKAMYTMPKVKEKMQKAMYRVSERYDFYLFFLILTPGF
jgi:hypothetical protein